MVKALVSKRKLVGLWREVQAERVEFLKRVGEIENRFAKDNNLDLDDVHVAWLEEMIIGIEVVKNRGTGKQKSRVYYEMDLEGESL